MSNNEALKCVVASELLLNLSQGTIAMHWRNQTGSHESMTCGLVADKTQAVRLC